MQKKGARIIKDNKSGTYWLITYIPELEDKKLKRIVLKFLKM